METDTNRFYIRLGKDDDAKLTKLAEAASLKQGEAITRVTVIRRLIRAAARREKVG